MSDAHNIEVFARSRARGMQPAPLQVYQKRRLVCLCFSSSLRSRIPEATHLRRTPSCISPATLLPNSGFWHERPAPISRDVDITKAAKVRSTARAKERRLLSIGRRDARGKTRHRQHRSALGTVWIVLLDRPPQPSPCVKRVPLEDL